LIFLGARYLLFILHSKRCGTTKEFLTWLPHVRDAIGSKGCQQADHISNGNSAEVLPLF
jgi:hypothetical protein